MLIRQIVSRLRNDIKEHTGDTVLTNRHLWNIFYTKAQLLLERDKKNIYNIDVFETASIDTEEVNELEDTCVPICKLSCRAKLPDSVEFKTGLTYRYIATADLSTNFHLVNPSSFIRKTGIQGNKQNYAYLENGYLYLSKCYPCISVSYIPKDLTSSDDKDTCSKLDQNTILPDYLIDGAMTAALQELQLFKSVGYDHSQNKSTTT